MNIILFLPITIGSLVKSTFFFIKWRIKRKEPRDWASLYTTLFSPLLPTPPGITPWARLKPFNYDRYSLWVSLAFAARIIICRWLKSNAVLETVPSYDQPVGLNKFYKKKKYACTLIRIVFELNRLKHKNNELVASFTGHALYDVWNHSTERSQLFEYL